MLSFERVLEVFQDYLQKDPLYEVVLTSHGYALLAWEPCQNDWYRIKHMATPKVLLDSLMDTYANYLEDQITENRRELTAEEAKEIQAKCRLLYERCQA